MRWFAVAAAMTLATVVAAACGARDAPARPSAPALTAETVFARVNDALTSSDGRVLHMTATTTLEGGYDRVVDAWTDAGTGRTVAEVRAHFLAADAAVQTWVMDEERWSVRDSTGATLLRSAPACPNGLRGALAVVLACDDGRASVAAVAPDAGDGLVRIEINRESVEPGARLRWFEELIVDAKTWLPVRMHSSATSVRHGVEAPPFERDTTFGFERVAPGDPRAAVTSGVLGAATSPANADGGRGMAAIAGPALDVSAAELTGYRQLASYRRTDDPVGAPMMTVETWDRAAWLVSRAWPRVAAEREASCLIGDDLDAASAVARCLRPDGSATAIVASDAAVRVARLRGVPAEDVEPLLAEVLLRRP